MELLAAAIGILAGVVAGWLLFPGPIEPMCPACGRPMASVRSEWYEEWSRWKCQCGCWRHEA